MRATPHATDTGRFAVLHDAAESMLDDLHERYMVERRENKELLGAEEVPEELGHGGVVDQGEGVIGPDRPVEPHERLGADREGEVGPVDTDDRLEGR